MPRKMFRVNAASVFPGCCNSSRKGRRRKWDQAEGRRKYKMQSTRRICTSCSPSPSSPSSRFLLVLYFYPVSRTRDWELLKATKEDIRVYRVAAEGKYEKANAQMEGRNLALVVSEILGKRRRRRRTDCYFSVSICCVFLRVRPFRPSPHF